MKVVRKMTLTRELLNYYIKKDRNSKFGIPRTNQDFKIVKAEIEKFEASLFAWKAINIIWALICLSLLFK